MSELDRLAAACLQPSFPGHVVPDWVARWLERGLGGITLFAYNVRDPGQLAELTGALRAERPELLISIDEEGGDVTRLEAEHGSSYPGNLALGAVDDVALTEAVAGAIAGELAAAGVNLNLAPVADANTNPLNPVIGVRSFGADPELVARHVAAFVTGTQRQGVAACAKHFPGHGDTAADSHRELPVIEGDLDAALLPFRAAIAAGTRAVMPGHLLVPALDDAPASLSEPILSGLLRGELGFDGLIVTDALEMAAVSSTYGVEEAAVRALIAGADSLGLGHDLHEDAVERVHAAIVERRPHRSAHGGAPGGGGGPRRRPRPVGVADERRRSRPRGRRRGSAARAPGVGRRHDRRPDPGPRAHSRSEHRCRGSRARPRRRPPRRRLGSASRGARRSGRAPWRSTTDAASSSSRATPARHAWQEETVAAATALRPDLVVVETGIPGSRPEAGAFIATLGAGRANLEAMAAATR